MSEELDKINKSLDAIGESIIGERKAQEELEKRIAKGESGQAEMAEQVKKWEAETNDRLEQKAQLEKMAAAIQRMGNKTEENHEGKNLDRKALNSGFRMMMKSRGVTTNGHTGLPEAEQKALSNAIDPDGGYRVEEFMSAEVERILFDTSPVRALASVTSIGTSSFTKILKDNRMGAAWAGELEGRTAQDTIKIGKIEIPVHELYSYQYVTQQHIEDGGYDVIGETTMDASEEFALTEATAFVTGVGSIDPRGFTTYDQKTTAPSVYARGEVGTIVAAGATAITTDEFVDLRGTMKAGYRGNAYFAYNRATETIVRKLKDGDGNYIWQPVYAMGEPDTLLGQRTVIMEDMADAEANGISVVLADFRKSYQIVDRIGISLLDDPFTGGQYRILKYRKRVGAGLKNWDAIKYLKQGA